MKKCSKCKHYLQSASFYKNKAMKDGLEHYCKTCRSDVSKNISLELKQKKRKTASAWNVANVEKYNQIARAQSRKRRALKKLGDFESYTEGQVLEHYGTDCHLCSTPIDLAAQRKVGRDGWELGLHIDHLVPISKGGHDSLQNVRPSHGLCNIIKHSSLL